MGALRKTPKTEFGVGDSLGWLTRNVWENKLFNWATVAFGFYALYAGAAPGLNDPATNFQGLIEFITTSRFAAVSIADLSLITLILTKEVTDDYKIRCRGSTAENSKRAPFIGASTALLPVLGAAEDQFRRRRKTTTRCTVTVVQKKQITEMFTL